MDNKTISSSTEIKKAPITPEAIFQIDNLNECIDEAINSGIPYNSLFQLRRKKIISLIGVELPHLLPEENNCITQISALIKELSQINSESNFKKRPSICDKIFRLIFKYVYYRHNGILTHLENGSHFYNKSNDTPVSIYRSQHWGDIYITSRFEAHKTARLEELKKYFLNPIVKEILALLKGMVPALFKQAQTFEESMAARNNPYSDPEIQFIEPPLLNEMCEILKLLANINKNNDISQTLALLNKIVKNFNLEKSYDYIFNLIAKVYVPIECLAFCPQNEATYTTKEFLSTCLMHGIIYTKLISYDLLETSDTKIKAAENSLKNGKSSEQEKIEAGRLLKYASIPWQYIINISALLFKLDRIKKIDENTIISANQELKTVWQNLLPYLQDLITHETAIAAEKIDFSMICFKPLPEVQYAALKYLGSYGGDVLFLHKIISVLSELSELDFNNPFSTEAHLRLIMILGECGKNISPLVKKILGKKYWTVLATLRDQIAHSNIFLHNLQATLNENPEYAHKLKNDLLLLLKIVSEIYEQLPTNWEDIKSFYSRDLATIIPSANTLGEGLTSILEIIDSALTKDEIAELRASKKNHVSKLEAKRDQVSKVLNKEIAADAIDQSDFFVLVDSLYPLPQKQKNKIKEYYKKLRQKKEKELPLATLVALRNIKPKTDAELIEAIESLIKKLKEIDENTLETKLVEIGLIDTNTKNLWKNLWLKFRLKHDPNNSWSLTKIIIDSINAAKQIKFHLKRLAQLVYPENSSTMLNIEQVWHDPILCLALEFHFTRIRIYNDIIQVALGYLPQYQSTHEILLAINKLYHSLEIKLKNIRLYGNSLAHLHDVTALDGRTTLGHRVTAYQELLEAIDHYIPHNSLFSHIDNYINLLTSAFENSRVKLIAQLADNRAAYESRYRWQQQALTKLPDLKLSDYQILTTLHKIDDADPDIIIKKQLYAATKQLFDLQQQFLHLQNLMPPPINSKNNSDSTKKYALIGQEKIFFEEINAAGDGWRTLNAIGIPNSSMAIKELKNLLANPIIVNYIRRAIENNFQASISLKENFDIAGVDEENNSIKDKINALYLNCQNANDENAYLTMLHYLERPEVQLAYLNYLLKTRYVDSNIAAACLFLQGKKLALFIDYGLPDGKLVNNTDDRVSPTDSNTVCLIFHPNQGQAAAHYNVLKINSNKPEANYSATQLNKTHGFLSTNNTSTVQAQKDPLAGAEQAQNPKI